MATQASSLSALLARTTIQDHEELLKSSNEELKKNKGDLTAQHAKIVALLKLDRYQEAIHVFESAGDGLKDRAQLELAYTLYRVGRLEDAAKVATTSNSRAGKHVKAQALYRMEDFASVAKLYRELAADQVPSEENEMRANRSAVDAQLAWQTRTDQVQNIKPSRQDLEAYETAFNAACGCIARGEIGQAEILLRRARELCRHSEYLPDEEKAAELLSIGVQQLYTLQKLGKFEEAESLAAQIRSEEMSDSSIQKVAMNNLLCLPSRPSNAFLLHKLFQSSPETTGKDKLFSFQSDLYQANAYIADLGASKYDGVARSTSKAAASHDGTRTSSKAIALSVLHAAAKSRGATGKAGIKALTRELEKRPTDVGLVILLVQLYVTANNLSLAVGVLESFFQNVENSGSEQDEALRYSPGLVGILVVLYKLQGRASHVTEELNKAASYWKQASDTPPRSLLLAAGKSLLASGQSSHDIESAKEVFATLHSKYPADPEVSLGYIASHALSSSGPGNISDQDLPSVSEVIAGVDIEALEESGIPKPVLLTARKASIANALGQTKKRAAGDVGNPAKRRRLPKSRIPKDYVEGKDLDPDRWLALRERASYRPKKGKKGKDRDRGTQGGVVKDDAGTTKGEQGGGGGGGGGGKSKKKNKKK